MDLFVVPTISFRLLDGLLIIGHEHKTGVLLTSGKLARLELWCDLLCSLYEIRSFNPVASIQ
jgi:hypothetical protein